MKSVAMAVVLTAAMGGVVVLAGRDMPVVQHEIVYLTESAPPATPPAKQVNHTTAPPITTTE